MLIAAASCGQVLRAARDLAGVPEHRGKFPIGELYATVRSGNCEQLHLVVVDRAAAGHIKGNPCLQDVIIGPEIRPRPYLCLSGELHSRARLPCQSRTTKCGLSGDRKQTGAGPWRNP